MIKKLNIIIRKFFKDKLWEIEASKLPRYQHYAINLLKVIVLAFRGFKRDECPVRSSALTYFSLLSLVPVIAWINCWNMKLRRISNHSRK